MANTQAKIDINIETKIVLELSVAEAAALNMMTTYGITNFLKGYKEKLGRTYIEPHEQGLTDLFKTVKENLPSQLTKIENFQQEINHAISTLKEDD